MADFVNFYKGKQEDFAKISSGNYVAGAFYLTTDTERLYFANTDSSILDLNQYITIVESVSALSYLTKPAEHGDFYYCELENVLCYYDNGWKQININTDTTTQEITTSKTVNEETDTITLQLYFKEQSSSTMTNATPVEFTKTWEITREDIYDIIPEPEVDIVAIVAEDMSLQIKTSGDGSDPDGTGINIIPGDNISFSDAGNSKITINSAVYTLGSEANSTEVHLKDNLVDDESSDDTLVTFEAGHQISVSGAESNKIKYSHGSITTTPVPAPEQQNVSWSMEVPHIQSLRFEPTAEEGGGNANGHVYGYTTHTFVMPDEPSYKIDEFKLGSNPGDLVLKISDHANTASSNQYSEATLSKGLYYRIINEAGNEEFYYNTDILPVYTIEQVEKRLQGLNAITYKGTTNQDLPTTNVRVGDAWMATQHGSYGDSTTVFVLADGTVAQPGILEHVEPGDLFIATGTEDVYDGVTGGDVASGYITSDLQWTYIPAGNDYDSQYYLTHNNNTVSLTSNAASNPDMKDSFNGSITFQQDHTDNDDVLVVCADDQKSTGAETITVTYKHKEYGENDITNPTTHTSALSYNDSFTAKVIDEVSNGHVKSYHTQTYVMPAPQKVEINSKENEATLYLTDDTRNPQNIVQFLDDTETLANGSTTKIIEATTPAANQIKFKHRRTGCTGPASTVKDDLAWSTQYDFITSLTPTPEGDGHLQSYVYSTLTMPNDPSIKKVDLSVVTNTEHEISVKEHFYSPDGQTRDINNTTTYKTNTDSLQLSVAVSGDAETSHEMTATVNVDLVWKSF